MEKRYKKLMRKVKAYLLIEQRKKNNMGRFVRTIGNRLFDEHYWAWERRGISVGAGWGAAAAVSPLPFQTLWAILAALWKKGNIPVSIAMAWASPPMFMVFFTPVQWFIGHLIFSLFGSSGSGLTYGMVKQAAKQMSFAPLDGVHIMLGVSEYLLGVALTCSVIGLLAFCIVQGLWELFSPTTEK